MIKVRLCFTLVGKTEAFVRGLPKEDADRFNNSDRLDFVYDLVADQFGDRAITIVDEKQLRRNMAVYPKYYSVGWFVDEHNREAVIIAHASTMELANKSVMEYVVSCEWNDISESIYYD